MKIWYDITNSPQVHFLLAIRKIINEIDPSCSEIITARNFSETINMLSQRVGKDSFCSIGEHHGKSKINKALGLFDRFNHIRKLNLNYDVSISCGSEAAIWNAKLAKQKSIAFGDNDLARQWTYGKFVDKAFFPDSISPAILEKQGLQGKLYQYHGYKEDIYLAYYSPDKSFLDSIPFDHYVVVRPENVMANYISNNNIGTITPSLLKKLDSKGINILYLPRYEIDKQYAVGIRNIYVPEFPINGLDACFFSDAVLTGAGTLAREAACLGVPAYSFFAGNKLLSVDRDLIKKGKMQFSRNVDELSDWLIKSNKTEPDLQRCTNVKEEVSNQLKEFIY